MSRLIIFLFVLAVLINLTGCKHEKPTHTICLLDVSKSITPDGVDLSSKPWRILSTRCSVAIDSL